MEIVIFPANISSKDEKSTFYTIKNQTRLKALKLRVVQTQTIPFFKINIGNNRIRHRETLKRIWMTLPSIDFE